MKRLGLIHYAFAIHTGNFGHWTEHGGPWCLHAAQRDKDDLSDAAYWASLGLHKLAEDRLERRRQRRILMGWPTKGDE